LIESHHCGNQDFCWSGKLYSIVFILILAVLLRKKITFSELGLRLQQNKKSVRFSLIFILLFFMISMAIGLVSKKTPFDVETLLFTAIMPGINEELVYRGFLLGLLNKIFERKFRFFKTNFGWGAIVTSLVFGILHGFYIREIFPRQDFYGIKSHPDNDFRKAEQGERCRNGCLYQGAFHGVYQHSTGPAPGSQ
jgi:membrane protease YdiL (CAAX protease family)